MKAADFLRQLWSGHRVLLVVTGLLLLANVVLALTLQYYLVPTVSEREQQLLRGQSELRGGGSTSPAQLYAQGEKDMAAYRAKIPAYREFTGLLVELQSLADAADLDLSRISYQHGEEKEAGLQRYTLSFGLVGSYRDIKKFLHTLEQSPRMISVGQIGLQGVGEDAETDVSLQLKLETFFRTGAP